MSTTTVKMSPGQLGVAIRSAGKKMPEAIRRGALIGAGRGRALLVGKSPTFDGHFRNAWRASGGAGTTVGAITNSAPHAGIVERGARPHLVSEEGRAAIREWFRRKVGLTGKELERAVRGLVERLRTKGQKGTFVVRDHLGDLTRFAVAEILEHVKQQLNLPGTTP